MKKIQKANISPNISHGDSTTREEVEKYQETSLSFFCLEKDQIEDKYYQEEDSDFDEFSKTDGKDEDLKKSSESHTMPERTHGAGDSHRYSELGQSRPLGSEKTFKREDGQRSSRQ